MDGTSFDQLARRVASSTRRDLLRSTMAAFGGLLVAPRLGRAQGGGPVVVGGACATTAECRQAEMQLGAICADNGFPTDGDLTCCLERGCCTSDADCCGDRRCAPTPDVCFVCAEPPVPTRAVGQICLSDQDCIPSPSVEIACVDGRCACLGPSDLCSVFASVPPIPAIPEADAALAVAEELSFLEVAGEFDALYDRMHPDAQRIIPRQAVVGWYSENIAPGGADPAQAIKVRFIPWTWEVTGQGYSHTAEVAYRQRRADGTVITDVVRLVPDEHGNWSWFFGRDRAFVEAQFDRFGGDPESP